MSLENRIRQLGGVTHVARKTKVSRATLYKAFAREAETGHHSIDTATANRIAQAFGRTTQWILEGEAGEPKKSPDSLKTARELASVIANSYEISDRDAWLLLYDLDVQENTWAPLLAAAMRRLAALGVKPRAENVPQEGPDGRSTSAR